MPIGSFDKGREKTIVFDTWANIGVDELEIYWECELVGDELALLRNLRNP
jgi:hypothetical protein